MIKKILREDGVFSFRVTSQINYLSHEQSLYLSSLYRTLKQNFVNVVVLPGSNSTFLASPRGELHTDWKEIMESLKKDSIQTLFVSEYFLPDRLSPERVEYLESSILSQNGKINFDLSPICYYYNTILWGSLFQSAEKPFFLWLATIPGFFYLLVPFLIIFILFYLLYKGKSKRSNLALGAIFMAGFTSIFLEIVVLLGFQILYGYIYSKMGLILTSFMLGLAVGAYISKKKAEKGELNFGFLSRVQLIQVILPLVLLFLINLFSKLVVSELWIEISLLSLMAFCGIIGGLEFTTANHLYFQENKRKKAGTGYSIDLLASAISSILVSAILIPLLGIPLSLWGLILINIVCFGYLMLLKKDYQVRAP
jgi:spermidine synthase